MKKQILYIGLVLMTVVSCNKVPLPELPEENEPYYSIKGNVGGDDVAVNVGEDGNVIHDGMTNINGVQAFYGELSSPENNLKFRIEIIEPELLDDSYELIKEEIPLLHHEKGCVQLNFGAYGGSQLNFLLVENDQGDLVPASSVTFDEFGDYEIGFQFADYGLQTFKVPVRYGFQKTNLNAGFTATDAGVEDSLYLMADTVYGIHNWYVDDQLFSTDINPVMKVQNGIYKITHEIVDQFDNRSQETNLIRYKGGHFYWQMNYEYCDDAIDKNNFGKVILSLEKDGVWYYSDVELSSVEESFSVDEIQYHVDSNLNPEWASFKFELNATLYSKDLSQSITLSDLEGKFKVGLK